MRKYTNLLIGIGIVIVLIIAGLFTGLFVKKDQRDSEPEKLFTIQLERQIKKDSDIIRCNVLEEEQGKLNFSWYKDGAQIVNDGNYYELTDEDYEHWIKVVVSDEKEGNYRGNDSIYVSNLPVVYIDTKNQEQITSKSEYKEATVTMQGGEDYSDLGANQIRIRERYDERWVYQAKQYEVKSDDGIDFFGDGKRAYWQLTPNTVDPCMQRNLLALWMSEKLGLPTMQRKSVALVLNGDYVGCYSLFEQYRDVFSFNTEYDDKMPYFVSAGEVSDGYLIDLYNEHEDEKLEYAQEYWDAFEKSINIYEEEDLDEDDELYGEDEDGEEKKPKRKKYMDWDEYGSYVDIDSLISVWLMLEVLGNDDKFASLYFTFDEEKGKFYFGPVADFSWGCGSVESSQEPRGWKSSWKFPWNNLVEDPAFRSKAVQKYKELRSLIKTEVQCERGFMETQYEKLKEAGIAMDGLYSQPRAYEEDHSAFKNYFKIRLLWLDNEFAEMEEDLENLEEESEEESEEDSESLD